MALCQLKVIFGYQTRKAVTYTDYFHAIFYNGCLSDAPDSGIYSGAIAAGSQNTNCLGYSVLAHVALW
jgi:hypothetical protein